ncbi:MAG: 4-hydroxy-3-methylbut-2-enyl diphosphate reductase [Ruminococcaceae bacterium]|nr:4-hydroxy-3-methylbut-2-enyl diphosphate reductase [Oscillospiraceae bacterium]
MDKITVAKYAGFCFGVKHAVDTVEKLLTNHIDAKIYTLGKLIHNNYITDGFEKRGVSIAQIHDIETIAESTINSAEVYLVIRAHGVTQKVLELLQNCSDKYPKFHYIDCTCPNVKKIHDIAKKNTSDDTLFIVIGSPRHPEVQSIVSFAKGEVKIFEDSKQLEVFLLSDNFNAFSQKQSILCAQTTQNLYEWEKCQKILQKLCTNSNIFDTICGVTETRQKEAEHLAREHDAVIIIGGRDSSNSNKLHQVSCSVNPNSFFVEDASAINTAVFSPFRSVAITAGASTPGIIIQEVLNKMSEQNFEQMLNDSFKTILTGDTVTGVILMVSQSEITVDLGCKVTGIIPYNEITDTPNVDLTTMYKPGDEIEAFVIRVSDVDGMATLSKKKIDARKNLQFVIDAKESGETLEGRVIEAVRGGVIVSTNLVRVFVPASQTGVPKDGDIKSIIGQTVKFKVIETDIAKRRVIGSIRSAAYEERKALEDAFWANIEVGKIYEGKVVRLATYGAFVLLDNAVQGMVHNSELSWRRIKHPSEIVKEGDVIKVFVKSIDAEKRHISLGYKTEDTNPWKILHDKYEVGDIASVKITAVLDNLGAFAEVVPGQDGLIHISQISKERVEKTSDQLKVGDIVDAKITAIDEENHKISLSIRAIIEDSEKAEAEAVQVEEDSE